MFFLKNFIRGRFYYLLLIIGLITSCKKTSDDPGPDNPPNTIDLNIDPATTFQEIAGFGGANQMWGTQFPNASDMKSAFGMDEADLGFSIFRIRISSNPDEWSLIVDVAKEAQKYGAKIIASPWSPPPSLKSNTSDVGGYLPEENYGTFVDHLNGFTDYMTSQGVSIYAISIQNEPDIQVSYESCDWTSTQMRDFLRDYGHLITRGKIAAAESFNFNQGYTNVILNDEAAASNLDIVTGHIYGGGLAPYSLAEQKDKEIWMTEYLLNKNATDQWAQLGEDVIWDETLDMLQTIHEAMESNWNAYIWWYLKRYYSFIGDGTQGTTSGEILKRGYAFSHYSKFVRPGYERIGAELSTSDAMVTAYKGDGKTVIILINTSTEPIAGISILISNIAPVSAKRYVTSLARDRELYDMQQSEGKLLLPLLAKSVTTVVIED